MARRRGPSGPTGTTGASPATTGGRTKRNPPMPIARKPSNANGDQLNARGVPRGGRRGR